MNSPDIKDNFYWSAIHHWLFHGRKVMILFTFSFLILFKIPVRAQLGELPLKAFFLQAALRFITWPISESVDTTSNFTIGYFKNDNFAAQLKQLLSKKDIKGKPVSFLLIDTLSKLDFCNLVLISEAEKKNINLIIENIKNKSILSVGTYAGFITSGVQICLLIENQKIVCYINEEESSNSNLKISYHLLQKSKICRTESAKSKK